MILAGKNAGMVARRPRPAATLFVTALAACAFAYSIRDALKGAAYDASGGGVAASAAGATGRTLLQQESSRGGGPPRDGSDTADSPPVTATHHPRRHHRRHGSSGGSGARREPGPLQHGGRCVGTVGGWCGPYYDQPLVPLKAAPMLGKRCPRGCSGVGACHGDSGRCECPAGECVPSR